MAYGQFEHMKEPGEAPGLLLKMHAAAVMTLIGLESKDLTVRVTGVIGAMKPVVTPRENKAEFGELVE